MLRRNPIVIGVVCLIFTTTIPAFKLIDAKNGANNGDKFGDAYEGLGDINGDASADFLVMDFKKSMDEMLGFLYSDLLEGRQANAIFRFI